MSVPGIPVLSVRPYATNQTLEFYWSPPTSDGGSPITSYQLSDGVTPSTLTTGFGYAKVTGLTNDQPYTYTLAASNANGLGEATPFRTVRPGFKPGAPTLPSYSNFAGLKYGINWTLPSSNGDANLLGHTLTAIPLDASGELLPNSPAKIYKSVVGSDLQAGFISLTTNYNWKVLIQAVNDPGYSPATCYTSTITLATPYLLLDTIATYLRSYMSDFRNPSFYNYWLDGNGSNISDGGGDMYDSGNVTTPWLRSGTQYAGSTGWSEGSYPNAVNYCNITTTLTDTDFYYVSLGYTQYTGSGIQDPTYLPLTVIGARSSSNQPVGWQVGGDTGADGGGTLASGLFYNNSTINTFQTYAFFREQYNAGDPSHCDLYMLLGHSNWGTTFGTVSTFAQPVSTNGCGGWLYAAGTGSRNILAIKTLLSKSGGVLVTSNECAAVVQSFTLRIKEALGY